MRFIYVDGCRERVEVWVGKCNGSLGVWRIIKRFLKWDWREYGDKFY